MDRAPVGTAEPSEAVAGERLRRWEQRTRWIIILAALLPLVGILDDTDSAGHLAVDLVTWLVFAVDLAVHVRWSRRYLATRWGMIDLGIVVLTFPWYAIVGLGGTELVVIARLARLVRIVVVSARSNLIELFRRLGKAAVSAAALCVVAGGIVVRVEPAESGFRHLGDGLWWSIVTLTTVGYGDLFPVTAAGRVLAVVLMLAGLAFLGTIAGSLASLFQSDDAVETEAASPAIARAVDVESLRDEIRALHDKLDRLAPADRTPEG